MTTPTTPPPHRISAESKPPFSSWLWHYSQLKWVRYTDRFTEPVIDLTAYGYTYWLEDSMEPPTARPEQAINQRVGFFENFKDTSKPAPTAAGTPRTDYLWLTIYPHDQPQDQRLERVLIFARTLERELAAANLRADCLATDVKVWAKAHADTLAKLEDYSKQVAEYRETGIAINHALNKAGSSGCSEVEQIESLASKLEVVTNELEQQNLIWKQRVISNEIVDEASQNREDDLRAKLTAAEQQVAELTRERDELKFDNSVKTQTLNSANKYEKDRHLFFCAASEAVGLKGEVGSLAGIERKIVERIATARRDTERLAWLLDRATVHGGGDGANYIITFRTPLDTECDIAALDTAIALHPSDAKNQP